jgi:hypothetical protein
MLFSHTNCSPRTICVKEKAAEKVFSYPPRQRLVSADGRGCVRAEGAIPLPRIGRRSGGLLALAMLGALGLRCSIRVATLANTYWAAVGHGLQVCDFALVLHKDEVWGGVGEMAIKELDRDNSKRQKP